MGLFAKIKSAVMTSAAGKIAAAAAVLVVIGGGTVGLTYAGVFTGAEAAVGVAAGNTFVGQTSSLEEVFGLKALSAALKEQGAQVSAKISVKELPLGGLGLENMTLPNAGFHLVASVTPQNTLSAVLAARVANTTLLAGNVYLDKAQLQVTVPKLFQSVLTLNHGDADIAAQMKSSYAAAYLGLTEEQIETIADVLPKQTTTVDKEEIQKKLIEILVSNYNQFLGETKLKKAGREEIHGEETVQKCKVYAAEMDGQEVGQFLNMSHVTIQEYIKEIGAEYSIAPQQVEEAFGDAGALMYQIKSRMRGPVVVKFYVWEERIAKISADWTMEVCSEEDRTTEPGSLIINFASKGNPAETMYLAIHTPVHQDAAVTNVPQKIDFVYQTTTENTEDVYSAAYDVEYNGDRLSFTFAYEKLDGDFTLKASAPNQSLQVTGAIGELEKGRKIGLELDACNYVEGSYAEERELDVEISLAVLEEEVTAPAGRQQDVLQMTENDFAALEAEITKNITWMLFSMMGLLK